MGNFILQQEQDKFRHPTGNLSQWAVGVVNPDGTDVAGSLPTVTISNATLYAVVNSGTAEITGNVTLNPGPNWIGMATVNVSNPTLYAVVNTSAPGTTNSLATLLASNNWIGLVSTASIQGNVAIPAGATVYQGTTPWNSLGTMTLGSSLAAGNNYIGSATITIGKPIMAGTNFIGLVSTASVHAKSETVRAKQFNIAPIGLYASGNATIFVPTGTFYVTDLVLNASATQTIKILSGATYLVGNASVGLTIAPMSGFVDKGNIDTPAYFGLAANAAFVINSSATGYVAGKVIYYVE